MDTKPTISSRIETIDPETAAKYLEHNLINRPIRKSRIEDYALDMRKGHWMINHQGIAFDSEKNLIDGQHRLSAIILANVAVKMMVVRGVDSSQDNGNVCVMDTVDRGKIRSVGDQLVLRHGCTNGALTSAVISTVATICVSGNYVKTSVPTALSILELYSGEIRHCIENRSSEKGVRSAIVIGSIAFGMKSDKSKAEAFYNLLVSGEGLFKTGATSPVYTLRKYLMSESAYGTAARWRDCCATLNCLKHWVIGEQLTQLKHTKLGVEYFLQRQKSNVDKVIGFISI